MLIILLCGTTLYVSEDSETLPIVNLDGPDPDKFDPWMHTDIYKLHHDFVDAEVSPDLELLYMEIFELSVIGDFSTLVEEQLTIAEDLGREMPNPAFLRERKNPTKFGVGEDGFPDRKLPGLPADTGDMFMRRIAQNGEGDQFFPRPLDVGTLERYLGHSLREISEELRG
jgi:hypothetical protein